MPVPLPPAAAALLDSRPAAVLTTTGPSGAPESTVVWLLRDGDQLVVASERGRRKVANVGRDPRVALVAVDRSDDFTYVEVRGTAGVEGDPGGAVVRRLYAAYTRGLPPASALGGDRVVLRVTPQRVRVQGDPGISRQRWADATQR